MHTPHSFSLFRLLICVFPSPTGRALKKESSELDDEVQALTKQAKPQFDTGISFEGGLRRQITASYGADHKRITGSLFESVRPSIDKLEDIVQKLDTSGDGTIEPSEVKVLIAKLMDIPEQQIPDDHEDILAFAGLSNDELAMKLFETVPKERVDKFHQALFGGEMDSEASGAET